MVYQEAGTGVFHSINHFCRPTCPCILLKASSTHEEMLSPSLPSKQQAHSVPSLQTNQKETAQNESGASTYPKGIEAYRDNLKQQHCQHRTQLGFFVRPVLCSFTTVALLSVTDQSIQPVKPSSFEASHLQIQILYFIHLSLIL